MVRNGRLDSCWRYELSRRRGNDSLLVGGGAGRAAPSFNAAVDDVEEEAFMLVEEWADGVGAAACPLELAVGSGAVLAAGGARRALEGPGMVLMVIDVMNDE